ncbi:uncharacterized protein LOC123398961 isoform X2 [Hordeum vulgare subsp. vulgare]|uniref:uncharacterized protein LOC123398961 isoform X2 n=1 Tax=Hordeum vulgare subsp. vulgare TaxID=112509 RepID=UPI00162BEDA1|nr:uncharacterized protein LOC123398961 isoform X2 [Hordeum vulgare subsp. vulgare]XP_044949333.1 uncharacterized protein LOC123398961 isoform X2 [Hordeum vulgare subsp. vulgare]
MKLKIASGEEMVMRSMTMCLMMVSLSTSFPSFEEGIQFLNDGEQQQVQIMEAEPHLLLCVKKWCQTDRYESNDAGDQLGDVDALTAMAGSGGSGQTSYNPPHDSLICYPFISSPRQNENHLNLSYVGLLW